MSDTPPRYEDPTYPAPKPKLPFSKWTPFAVGVAVGLIYRLIFSQTEGGPYETMYLSFLSLVPFLVGAATVYVAERSERRSWSYYFWAGSFANVFVVLGTLLIMIEGIICALVIVPLLAVLGGIGGLVMGAVCRKTNWPTRTLYSFAALPLIFGALEPRLSVPTHIESVERRILIKASREVVWQQIWEARDIQPQEMESAWMYRIGVPLPEAGVSEQTPQGWVRRIRMGKNIHFDQVVTAFEPNRFVVWRYRFDEDSIPPAALDDHVKIGGRYFDLGNTSYTLNSVGADTELVIRMDYRLTTQFNWYANPVAEQLFGNFEETVLNFYRRRSEASLSPNSPPA